ncbi:MAG: cytidine deaminase [Peptoniphilus sp.]|nr:cytidine deaminase [Peptoniphilus sp.]MDD7362741.1 cytidine deaminase [Bacillota bacterium]MDY6044565.1 cytidine deaminase [Peptoniphilus sp.]
MTKKEKIEKLIVRAQEAQKKAYVPYSGYSVGAAVLTSDGDIFDGCNIENASYTPTVCAERVAIFKAVSEDASSIDAIAVVAGEDMGFPCGVCRQVMREFASEGLEIIVAKNKDEYECYHLEDLLPHSFGPENLKGGEHV